MAHKNRWLVVTDFLPLKLTLKTFWFVSQVMASFWLQEQDLAAYSLSVSASRCILALFQTAPRYFEFHITHRLNPLTSLYL